MGKKIFWFIYCAIMLIFLVTWLPISDTVEGGIYGYAFLIPFSFLSLILIYLVLKE